MVSNSRHSTMRLCLCHLQSYYGNGSGGGAGGYGGGRGGYGGGGGGGGWGGGGGGDRMSDLGGGLRTIDWANSKAPHFEKNFYVEDKRVTARSEREIEEFRRSKEIKARRCWAHFSDIETTH